MLALAPQRFLARLWPDDWASICVDLLAGLVLPPGSPGDLGLLCFQALAGEPAPATSLGERIATALLRAKALAFS